jgi:hypothetical protein
VVPATLVYAITEGAGTPVRQIDFTGNKALGRGRHCLRGQRFSLAGIALFQSGTAKAFEIMFAIGVVLPG